jgi:hypothetical protein
MIQRMQFVRVRILVASMLLFLSLGLLAQSANSIIGKWLNPESNSFIVEIYLSTDGCYYGKILEDKKIAEGNIKIIFKKLSYITAEKRFSGTMIPPGKDIELEASVCFIEHDKLEIKASKLFMTKTIQLNRIK